MTYHIDNYTAIDESTIVELTRTADADERGYLISCPSINRRLMAGRDAAGNWHLWISSNGDPCQLTEDNYMDIARDMADAPDHDPEQGYSRIADAIAAWDAPGDEVEFWADWKIHLEYLLHGGGMAD